jgi:hypothetical protein
MCSLAAHAAAATTANQTKITKQRSLSPAKNNTIVRCQQ